LELIFAFNALKTFNIVSNLASVKLSSILGVSLDFLINPCVAKTKISSLPVRILAKEKRK